MYYRSVLIAVWTCLMRTCLTRTNSRQILLDSCRQLSSWASWREHVGRKQMDREQLRISVSSSVYVFLLVARLGNNELISSLLITLNGVAKYVQNKQPHMHEMLLFYFVMMLDSTFSWFTSLVFMWSLNAPCSNSTRPHCLGHDSAFAAGR